MAAARTPTSDKSLGDLTKAITAGKPFTRAELAKRFKVASESTIVTSRDGHVRRW